MPLEKNARLRRSPRPPEKEPPRPVAPGLQIRRETLGSQVYDLLRDRILRGEIEGGTRLAQGPVSEELGTSRIPVRDALKRLEVDGLVTGDEIGRYTVVPFGVGDADEIYGIRRRLEPFAIEVAARSITPQTLDDVRALQSAMDAAARLRQLERYIALNVQFHMAIYEASGMRRLVRIIRGLWEGVPPLTPIMLEGRMKRSQSEHGRIVKALAVGNAEAAAAALAQHIDNAGLELIANMKKDRRRR
jgi:DNA-binding GntR family transcriptional regulator